MSSISEIVLYSAIGMLVLIIIYTGIVLFDPFGLIPTKTYVKTLVQIASLSVVGVILTLMLSIVNYVLAKLYSRYYIVFSEEDSKKATMGDCIRIAILLTLYALLMIILLISKSSLELLCTGW